MTRGISFKFNHRSDLDLAKAIVDDVVQEQFAGGRIELQQNGLTLGRVGQLDAETVKSIPKGSILSLVGDFNPNEGLALSKAVREVNASIDPQGRHDPVFSIVR